MMWSADRLKVHRGIFAAPIDFELELKSIAFIQRRDSRPLDCRNVDKGVGLAVVALDKAEALHRVEELDRATGLFSGQLALRSTGAGAASTAATALDWHRIAFDSQVGRRNTSAAIDERELERLTIREIGQSGLLNGRNVNENVFAAIIAYDEAEALLGVEEFDDALAFANDLGGHPAAAAAKSAAAATAESTAAAAAIAATAESTAITISATTAAVAATFLVATAEIAAE
jgi:hypothetical protein